MFWFHHPSHAEHLKKVAIGFFLLSLALLGVIFYISFSWATITVTPRPVAMNEAFMLAVAEGPSVEKNVLKGFLIEEDGEVKGTFMPTGEENRTQALEQVKGTITVVNQSKANQRLVETTRLLAPDGTLFRTTAYAVVPAGGRAEVPVVADEAKELPDLSSTRFLLPGLREAQRTLIYGVGFTQSVGGVSGKKIVQQTDIDMAVQALQKELEKQTERTLTTRAKDGELLAPAVASIVQPTTIEKTADVGDSVESFTVRLKAHVQAALYDMSRLEEAVTESLVAKLPPGYDLIPSPQGAISVALNSIDPAEKTAKLKVTAPAQRLRNADSPDFDRASLSGLSAEGIVNTLLARADDIESVDVQFYPFWVTRAPYLTDHINILVKK